MIFFQLAYQKTATILDVLRYIKHFVALLLAQQIKVENHWSILKMVLNSSFDLGGIFLLRNKSETKLNALLHNYHKLFLMVLKKILLLIFCLAPNRIFCLFLWMNFFYLSVCTSKCTLLEKYGNMLIDLQQTKILTQLPTKHL